MFGRNKIGIDDSNTSDMSVKFKNKVVPLSRDGPITTIDDVGDFAPPKNKSKKTRRPSDIIFKAKEDKIPFGSRINKVVDEDIVGEISKKPSRMPKKLKKVGGYIGGKKSYIKDGYFKFNLTKLGGIRSFFDIPSFNVYFLISFIVIILNIYKFNERIKKVKETDEYKKLSGKSKIWYEIYYSMQVIITFLGLLNLVITFIAVRSRKEKYLGALTTDYESIRSGISGFRLLLMFILNVVFLPFDDAFNAIEGNFWY